MPATLAPRLAPRLLALAACVFGCSGPRGAGGVHGEGDGRGAMITIRGSDTMVILTQSWAEAYMGAREDVAVQVSGGGSGTGIAALINGTVDLATASRGIKDHERGQLREAQGDEAVETRVAIDAVAVYVHEANPVPSLTLAELEGIYRGSITRWSQLGGPDEPLVLYGRENNSGAYSFFRDEVLHGYDFAPETQTLSGTSAVIHAVSQDLGGIGYGGIAYSEGVRRVPLARRAGAPAVMPDLGEAVTGRYPLARYLYVYTAGEPQGAAEDFLEFVLSPAGQRVIEGVGYYPLPDAPEALE